MPTTDTTVLGGRYALGPLLGRGGMADVYRAEDQLLERDVAVKVLRAVDPGSSDVDRFRDEMRTLANLEHPNVVTVLDAGRSDLGPYLVLELVEGPSLSAHRGQALEPRQAAVLGRELADALSYVHRRGIVHRDIKPGNILLDPSGRVRLTDFGIARLLSDATGHTATGATVGTAAYLSPEQVRGEEIGTAADIYALGLVLLETLSGRRIYQGTPAEAALARLTNPPEVPDTLPEGWQELLRSMTAMDPEQRATAFEATQRLAALAMGETEPVGTVPGPVPEPALRGSRPGRRSRRSRGPTLTAGRVLLACATGAVLIAVGGVVHAVESSGNQLPSVPANLQQPLQDLHRAVDG